MKPNEKYWYDIQTSLSYNGVYTFVIGNRGCGKTFSTLRFLINQFIKHKKCFVYLRRYGTQLDKALPKLFVKLQAKGLFTDHKLEIRGTKFYCDDEYMGEGMALTTASAIKGNEMPNVSYIYFDEFLEEPNSPYFFLKSEVSKFFGLWETINRDRDGKDIVKCIFTANNVTWNNPYFVNFKIWKNPNQLLYKRKFNEKYQRYDVIAHEVENIEFTEQKKNSTLGNIISDSEYAEYSIDNKVLLDNDTFIEKKSEIAMNTINLVYRGKVYGVWSSMKLGKIWISYKYNPNIRNFFTITLEDHQPNMMFIKSKRKPTYWTQMVDCFKMGQVRFENSQIKSAFYDIMKTCNIS